MRGVKADGSPSNSTPSNACPSVTSTKTSCAPSPASPTFVKSIVATPFASGRTLATTVAACGRKSRHNERSRGDVPQNGRPLGDSGSAPAAAMSASIAGAQSAPSRSVTSWVAVSDVLHGVRRSEGRNNMFPTRAGWSRRSST